MFLSSWGGFFLPSYAFQCSWEKFFLPSHASENQLLFDLLFDVSAGGWGGLNAISTTE